MCATRVVLEEKSEHCHIAKYFSTQVSLSTSGSCSGSFLVSNGVAKRPGCVFCNGSHDEVLYRPPYGSRAPSSCPDDHPAIIGKQSLLKVHATKIFGYIPYFVNATCFVFFYLIIFFLDILVLFFPYLFVYFRTLRRKRKIG